MKLLFILSEYLPDSGGGIISFYSNLLPRLAARGHQVKVLVACHGSMDRAARVEDGVEVEYLQSRFADAARAGCKKFRNDAFWAFLPLAWGAFHQAKGGEGFDIVEATDWGLLFMPWVVSERKAKVVVSLHGSNGQVDWFSNPEPRGFDGDVVRLAEVAALRLADAIHANSRANAEFWREKTGREIRVIPPVYAGRDATDGGGLMAESGENKADLTTECTEGTEGTPEPKVESPIRSSDAAASSPATSHPLLATAPKAQALDARRSTLDAPGLVVGRLQNWKGAEVLCKALEMVDGIQIEWVGGDTPWGKSGETASEYLKKTYPSVWATKLYWRGPLPHAEVLRKISECSFLVVPSLWDVFNLTVAEGMEAGVPVACSKSAGAEMLIEHGRSGFLFDPAKHEELADSLVLLATMPADERLEVVLRGSHSVGELLNTGRVLSLLEDSYTQALRGGDSSKKDAWVKSLLTPAPRIDARDKKGWLLRSIRRVGNALADV